MQSVIHHDSSDHGSRLRAHTSRWLTRADHHIRSPRDAFERVIREIVAARLPETRREVLGGEGEPP